MAQSYSARSYRSGQSAERFSSGYDESTYGSGSIYGDSTYAGDERTYGDEHRYRYDHDRSYRDYRNYGDDRSYRYDDDITYVDDRTYGDVSAYDSHTYEDASAYDSRTYGEGSTYDSRTYGDTSTYDSRTYEGGSVYESFPRYSADYGSNYGSSRYSGGSSSIRSRRDFTDRSVSQFSGRSSYIGSGGQSLYEDDFTVQESEPPPALYDLFFDIPHPAASPSCPRARAIDAPSSNNEEILASDLAVQTVMDELFDPSNIARIARFAFPEHDDDVLAAEIETMRLKNKHKNLSDGQTYDQSGSKHSTGTFEDDGSLTVGSNEDETLVSASAVQPGANLNRHDIYLRSFRPDTHTFTLQLSGGTHVQGHVRRYLPGHSQAQGRADIGRRGARAMVLLTRATGGERFYNALLKTIEVLSTEHECVDANLVPDEAPARTFLHALHGRHSQLVLEAKEKITFGSNLVYPSADMRDKGEAEAANTFMALHENLFSLSLEGLEFGGYGSVDDINPSTGRLGRLTVSGDSILYRLPPSLQPGYEATLTCTVEDQHSPILPLLRCIGVPHTLRLLSALLCENRVILVSKSATMLSNCVRAASAMLAQGLLCWRHVQIPVLPCHLLKYLDSDSPYLIGLLDKFAAKLDMLPMIHSVVCINLDRNEMRTYNMANASYAIPDLLQKKRRSKTADDVFSPAEFLAKDMAIILKNDKNLWNRMAGGRLGEIAGVTWSNEESSTINTDDEHLASKNGKGFMSVMAPIATALGLRNEKDEDSLAYARKLESESLSNGQQQTESAAYMGGVMRNARDRALQRQGMVPRGTHYSDSAYETSSVSDHSSASTDGRMRNRVFLDAGKACENERAEEELRAALTSFYLYVFGDMGMYLSEAEDGSLWLDRKKFLLRKKLMGDRESSPMFAVCVSLSRSLMFESFVRARIADLERPSSERAKMMPHHIPLFIYCEKYLRINHLKFTMANIRRVVSLTALSCPQHAVVDETEIIRAKALELTSSEPFRGNVVIAVKGLVAACRYVDVALPQVMAVIWARMADKSTSSWRHPLLALHLLKNLLLHGPLTAIADATDGIEKVRALQTYSSKIPSASRDVRFVAKQVFQLLIDRNQLFFKRRRASVERIYNPGKTNGALRFSDYLIRRLPITVGFRNMHILLRPTEPVRGTQVREMVSDAVMSVDRVPHDIVEGIMVGKVDDENNGEGVSVNKNTVADQSLNQDNNSRSLLLLGEKTVPSISDSITYDDAITNHNADTKAAPKD